MVRLPEYNQALQLLQNGQPAEAMQCIALLKRQPLSAPGADYLRALCFLEFQEIISAAEALKEELRYFPYNVEAQQLLMQLRKDCIPKRSDWPQEFDRLLQDIRPYSMVVDEALLSLYLRAREVCELGIEGDFVECGVGAGGSAALLAAVVKRYSKTKRKVYALDTFKGMPAPSLLDCRHGVSAEALGWGKGTASAPECSVREVARELGVDEFIEPIKGDFSKTIPPLLDHLRGIALLHIDASWYQSVSESLKLYDLLVPQAVMQVDDFFYWEGCRQAVKEFFRGRDKVNMSAVGFAGWTRTPSDSKLTNNTLFNLQAHGSLPFHVVRQQRSQGPLRFEDGRCPVQETFEAWEIGEISAFTESIGAHRVLCLGTPSGICATLMAAQGVQVKIVVPSSENDNRIAELRRQFMGQGFQGSVKIFSSETFEPIRAKKQFDLVFIADPQLETLLRGLRRYPKAIISSGEMRASFRARTNWSSRPLRNVVLHRKDTRSVVKVHRHAIAGVSSMREQE